MEDEQEQAIAKALSKYDLPNGGKEFRLMLLAYAKERGYERFYRHASKLAGDEKLRKSLDSFANEEADHQVRIQEVYFEVKGTLNMPDNVVDLLSKCPTEGPLVQPGVAPSEVFEMAIKLEKDGQLYFEARMAESEEPEVEELLEYLAVLEEEHYVRLKAMRDDMK